MPIIWQTITDEYDIPVNFESLNVWGPDVAASMRAQITAVGTEEGQLYYQTRNGQTLGPFVLPVAPGGTDEGVAGYLTDPTSQTRTELDRRLAELVVNAIDFGTDGAAIQQALNLALTSPGRVRVLVPDKGSDWAIGASLSVFSNTTLEVAKGVRLRSVGASPMLLNGNNNNTNPGGAANYNGYDGHSNIVISGGVWDCDAGSVTNTVRTAFAFQHGRNITCRDLTLANNGSGHAIELNALDGATIDNVVFDGFFNSNNRDDTEAIQIDAAIPGAFPWFGNLDRTVCKNVTITGCWVGNTNPAADLWWRGFGSHSCVVDAPYTGIKIVNNSIRVRHRAIAAYNWSRFVIANNTIEGGFIHVSPTDVGRSNDTINAAGVQTNASRSVGDGTIIGNTLAASAPIVQRGHAIWVVGTAAAPIKQLTITGNVIAGTSDTQCAIKLENTIGCTVVGNSVADITNFGIWVAASTQVTVQANHVRAATSHGIYLDGSRYCLVGSNVVAESAGVAIYAANGALDLRIVDNLIVGASKGTNSGFNAIHLASVTDSVVNANTVRRSPGGGNGPAAALFINSGSARIQHVMNDFRGSSNNAAVNDSGSASVTTTADMT